MNDASREAFEKWAVGRGCWTKQARNNRYLDEGTDHYWFAWQAAIAYATERHGDSHIGAGHPESVAVQSAEAAEQHLAQAVEAEREACAKVADMEAIQAIGCNPVFIARRIADAIRSRKGGPYAT